MNQTQLAKRQERAHEEPLVITKIDEGFRVYAAAEPKNRYVVSGSPQEPQCTCPDFQYHRDDPDWRCKHILAVLNEFSDIELTAPNTDRHDAEERKAIQEEGRPPRKPRASSSSNGNGKNGHPALLTLKRSVSPDGRIDSLSVEFSQPISELTADEIRAQAERMLGLQSSIAGCFLDQSGNHHGKGGSNGNGAVSRNGGSPNGTDGQAQGLRNATPTSSSTAAATPTPGGSPALPARLVAVGGMDTRRGRRLFLTVEVGGKTQKLFGKTEELIQHITAAGYHPPEPFQEGAVLNIPCLVTTKPSPDGRYQNVDRVFSLPASSADAQPRTRR